MGKKILMAVAIVAITMFVLLLFILRSGVQKVPKTINSPTPVVVTATPTEDTPTADTSDWKEYESDFLGISLKYPSNMEMSEESGQYVRFLLLGPTQSRGTEVYDGMILVFSKIEYEETTLKQYVENVISQKDEGVYIEITDIEDFRINNLTGYQFSETGLGTFTNVYLPASTNSAIHISYLLEDPQGEGFEEMLNSILNSLQIQK